MLFFDQSGDQVTSLTLLTIKNFPVLSLNFLLYEKLINMFCLFG